MRLNQITLPATDLEACLPFYKKLNCTLIVGAVPHYVRFLAPDGEQTFSLHKVDQMPDPGATVMYFECDNLDEQVEALKQKGLDFLFDPRDESWLWREARLRDPAGNEICLFYAGENRINPPWRVKE